MFAQQNHEFHNRAFNEDCIAGMAKRLPDASCDLIITDPPFAIEFGAKRSNYNRTESRVLDGYNEISACDYQQFSRDWLKQAKRVLKSSGSLFIFSGWNNLKEILIAADDLGFQQVNHIIWKYQFGVATKRRFVTSHYHCLFYCIDDRKRTFNLNSRFSGEERTTNGGSARYRDLEDVWNIKREYWTRETKTPTKLPREVVTKILDYASEPGDLVLDPFLGSGQVAVVSALMQRHYVGFEIVPEYFEFIQRRLASGTYRLKKEGGKTAKPKEGMMRLLEF
ncbi:MAG: site-specific DNA-methyltransferase [Anaerolineaceae bacterium]|nr:site-specific DNA-methyltransferase [Anaerolineaceae bacterium]